MELQNIRREFKKIVDGNSCDWFYSHPIIVCKKNATRKTATTGFGIPEAEAPIKQDVASVYKKLSSKYDVRNATFEEIVARAASHLKYGNIIGYQINSKLLAILQNSIQNKVRLS